MAEKRPVNMRSACGAELRMHKQEPTVAVQVSTLS